jgi:O-antigen ligase
MPSKPRRSSFKFAAMAAQEARQNRWTAFVIKAALVLVGLCGNSNFNGKILPGGEESPVLQVVVIAAWIVIAGVSYLRRAILPMDWGAGVFASMAFYGFAMFSVGWSADPLTSANKAVAMAIAIFGAYRLSRTMPLDDVLEYLIHALFALCAASIMLALFVPDIGVVNDWQHAGQWNGIFISKQSLGLVGAMTLFLASHRLIGASRSLYHWIVALAAFACIIGSGSRGGGVLAVIALLFIYLTGKSMKFARILAFAPFVMSLLGAVLIFYMVSTGNAHIIVLGEEIDLTGRTFIWQHAAAYFRSAPWLGFGLNGFWTRKDVKDLFIERHGWFLDNYHDGYIAIAVETGAIGMTLFIASYLLYALRISRDTARVGALHPDTAFSLVYTCLVFFIDFTETYFLRSTNMVSTLLVLNVFIVYAHRPDLAHEPTSGEPARRGAPRIRLQDQARVHGGRWRRRGSYLMKRSRTDA